MLGRDLRHAGCGDEVDVQPLVAVETVVARDQHGQVVDRVHDRHLGLLRRGRLARDFLGAHGSPPV
jgi:hypothetical protein